MCKIIFPIAEGLERKYRFYFRPAGRRFGRICFSSYTFLLKHGLQEGEALKRVEVPLTYQDFDSWTWSLFGDREW